MRAPHLRRPCRPPSRRRSDPGARVRFGHTRRLCAALLPLIALLVAAIGCYPNESVQIAQHYEPTGRLEVRIGQTLRRIPLADARCTRRDTENGTGLDIVADGHTRLVNRAGLLMRPTPLIARVPAHLGTSKTAFRTTPPSPYRIIGSLFDTTLRGKKYPMLQLLADPAVAEHTGEHRCRGWRDASHTYLSCEDITPFPWTAPGPIPRANLFAIFVCR